MQILKLTHPILLAVALASSVAVAQNQTQEFSSNPGAVDGIAAVINKEVITRSQVQKESAEVSKSLRAQNIPLPDADTLYKQVLQRMIDEKLIFQEAEQMGIRSSQVDVNQAAEVIASRNNLSINQLQAEIEKSGMTWDHYLQGLRQEVVMDEIRQRVIDPRISISESEVDAFLKSQGYDPAANRVAAAPNDIVELAQILIRIPDGASPAEQATLKRKADDILAQLRQGADFSGLAAASSEGSEALQGGALGARPLEGWPDVFAKAIQQVRPGQVTDVIRSGAGYHIIKVLNRGQSQLAAADTDMLVTQTRARHILVKFSEITSEEQAKNRIDQVAARLKQGENFEDLARSFSEDASAPQGGDLGWLHPGETVPAFEKAMDDLAIGQISAPVRSQFGWHIIRVDERRERNVGNEYMRMQARQMLKQQRVEPAFDDWMGQIRSQAFIDNRLDPEQSSGRRR